MPPLKTYEYEHIDWNAVKIYIEAHSEHEANKCLLSILKNPQDFVLK